MTAGRIRRFDAKDAALLAASVRDIHGEAASTDWLEAWLGDGTRHAVGAFEGERAIGLASAYELPRLKRDSTGLLLYEIDVLPTHRRRGIGAKLIDELRAIVRERDLDSTWLLTDDGNPAALALYASTGGVRHAVDQVMFQFSR